MEDIIKRIEALEKKVGIEKETAFEKWNNKEGMVMKPEPNSYHAITFDRKEGWNAALNAVINFLNEDDPFARKIKRELKEWDETRSNQQ